MKKTIKKAASILAIIIIFACDSESASDCFQTAGNTIQMRVDVPFFETILVNRDVALVLKQGENFEVIIETGENLINDVEAKVVGNQLQLTDTNNCNFTRDFGVTKVYVTAPNIIEIHCSTQFEISSVGILNFDELQLISENFNDSDSFPVGDFRLQVNTTQLRIISNSVSTFYISGATENLSVSFTNGVGRFEGENLIAQNVNIFHRASNDITINPQQTLSGELRGTGNLIAINEPSTVTVSQFYTGQLIFID